jgi:hypothetical protein
MPPGNCNVGREQGSAGRRVSPKVAACRRDEFLAVERHQQIRGTIERIGDSARGRRQLRKERRLTSLIEIHTGRHQGIGREAFRQFGIDGVLGGAAGRSGQSQRRNRGQPEAGASRDHHIMIADAAGPG